MQMTAEELKFALHVENVFNDIPQPEYRQLLVETLIILTTLTESPKVTFLPQTISICDLLQVANNIFIKKEVKNSLFVLHLNLIFNRLMMEPLKIF